MHVISGLTAGGAETVLFRLITASSGIDHEVISLGPPDWYSDRLQKRGIPVHHVNGSSPGGYLAAASQLRRLVKSSSADLVQCWMYRGNVFGGLCGRLAGKPVIWNIRASSLGPLRPASRLLAKVGGVLTGRLADHVINCSVNSAKLHARLGYDAADGTVIPNGYDAEIFRPDQAARAKTRASLGVAPDTFLIGAIARWHQQKGLPHLIRAVGILRRRGVPVRVLLVGIGLEPSNDRLMGLIEDADCGDMVQLLGYRPDAADIARALDVHVLAAIGAEGFPNAVAETMLAGTPNVVTDVGDAALIVDDTGWVVEPESAEQLADAIQRAHSEWSDSAAWAARRRRARERIAGTFSLGRMVEAYEKVWRSVASDRRLAQVDVTGRPPPHDSRLSILHVINDLGPGGAEALLYRFVTRDRANDHVVVSLGRPAWYSPRMDEQGITVHHLNIHSPLSSAKGVFELRRVMRHWNPDVVQCWMYRSNVFGGLVAKTLGKPTVWGIHCSSLEPLRLSSRMLARLGGVLARWNPDYIINCSARSAELHARLGYAAAPGQVVPNGYDPADFYPDESRRQHSRDALGISASTFLVGSVARWHPQKDIPNLLRAVRLAHEGGVPIYCLLIGHELRPENSALMDCIHEAGCDELTVPLWVRSDVPDLARALDLHVLASAGAEAFPNVVAETMLCGTPNAVTDVGDSALIVGDAGWVLEPRDSRQLADAIIEAYHEFASHAEEWNQRRRNARERIVQNFTHERMIKSYVTIWRQVSDGARPQVVAAAANDYTSAVGAPEGC